jgi:hypothetical protein
MYLPDTLSDVEQTSFIQLIESALLYPGDVSTYAQTHRDKDWRGE